MLWIFLLLAIALIVLAATNRIDAIDAGVSKLIRRVRLAWEYAKEDVDEVESAIRDQARRQSEESGSGAPADEPPPTRGPGSPGVG